MKRFLIVILIVCMCFSIFAGCQGKEENQIDDQAVQAEILNDFMKVTEIPRETGHERAVSSYLKNWAHENGFKVVRDSYHNVIIEKPASAGYENAPVTILHSNMDMHVAIADDTRFDPLNEHVAVIKNDKSYIAAGTSLGADSGMGIATALYVLKHSDKHGLLRVIFTSGGESDFSGAKGLNPKYLDGDYLINLNWDSQNTIGVSSAGTAAYEMKRAITWAPPKNTFPCEISISGLIGGDAENNVNDGGANAIKVIGETLAKAQGKGIIFELASFNGGLSDDTIPTAATAVIIINTADVNKLKDVLDNSIDEFKDTYGDVEKNYSFTYKEGVMPDKVVSLDDNGSIMTFLYGIVNGVQTTSNDFPSIPESSSNIGIVSTYTGNFLAGITAGSNSIAAIQEITSAHEAISSMSALEYHVKNNTPIWAYNPNSTLIKALQTVYQNTYNENADLEAVHRELDFSWFLEKNPKLQIASIGSSIKDANTPEEALMLDRVTNPATVILNFLKNTQEKTGESF